ncbi:long-chain fatty acid--CoA ligase [Nocardiopsis sp. MG754419]|uniref:long-chain fatty acid--CoA ligase n=1 Tax=Nocardiopsis sp. MG754419 TaxID=2259865 RepID=UPI001BA4E29D|nr:long-chain fatty acid--CoA ligase [Nocardiopsis sp. MG754419]MBR8743442.1 long-chain fatty acid--CoA ligase [Nocardiopsis sp. MG754419]
MSYTEVSPDRLFAEGTASDRLNEQPWLVRWDTVDEDPRASLDRLLPPAVEIWTSGSTGARRCWRHTREQLWDEAALLADVLAPERPEAVLSFAPPRHLYGLLGSVFVPALLRVPAWYRPRFFGAMPPAAAGRWGVVAVPWTFSILSRHLDWVRDTAHLSLLHSTAMLPGAADTFLRDVGADRATLSEVFGSTETGGIALRRHGGDGLWRLFDDVEFAEETGEHEDETPLAVRSPRLASEGEGRPLSRWRTDDHVQRVGERGFRFVGRRQALVKVNGRRYNLDLLERDLRAAVDCADLVCVPVAHEVSGEHVEVHVVPEPGRPPSTQAVRAQITAAGIGFLPSAVRFVEAVERTATGKPRRSPATALSTQE